MDAGDRNTESVEDIKAAAAEPMLNTASQLSVMCQMSVRIFAACLNVQKKWRDRTQSWRKGEEDADMTGIKN